MATIFGSNPVRSYNTDEIRITGRWQGGGAGADMTRIAGRGVTSVVYTTVSPATGQYTLTLDHPFPTFLGGSLTVNATAGTTAAAKVVNGVVYSASAGTLTMFVVDTATPTAKDLATTEELWLDLSFSTSNVTQ